MGGKLKSQQQLFDEVIVALQGMENVTERNAIASALMSTTGENLIPILNMTADEIENIKSKGNIISEDNLIKAKEFKDGLNSLQKQFMAVVQTLTVGVLPILNKLLEFVQGQMPKVQAIMTKLFEALAVAVENVIPLLLQVLETLLPPIIDLISELAAKVIPVLVDILQMLISSILPIVIDLFNLLIETVLPPLLDILNLLVTKLLPPLIKLFTDIIKAVLPPLMKLFKVLVDTILPPVIELLEIIIEEILPVLIDLVVDIVNNILPPLLEVFTELVKEVLPPVIKILMVIIKEVVPALAKVIKFLADVIKTNMDFISTIIKVTMKIIKGDWEGAFKLMEDFFVRTFEKIKNYAGKFKEFFVVIFQGISIVLKDIWAGIVNNIKTSINAIVWGLNKFIGGLNNIKIPDWVPKVGGKGINISKIPTLAEGGTVLQSGKVIVGESGPELFEAQAGARVTPLPKTDAKPQQEPQTVNNNINIAKMEVREEQDIKKIARELYNLQLAQARG
jgi:phage-related protein